MRNVHDDERGHHGPAERGVMRAPTSLLIAAIAAIAMIPACGDGRAMHPDASSLFRCMSNADCDDHIPCTVDNCDVSATCSHTGVDSMCTAPQHCVVGVGCSATMTCTDATMCDDAIACTLDTCNVGNVCGHMPINSMCSAPTPVCDATMGCIAGMAPECTTTAQCDDSIACTVDSCAADMTCRHMAVDSLCGASETCDASSGCVMRHDCTTVADCMNPSFWNFCDGIPVCSAEFGCMNPAPRMCDDGNRCTTDMCDRTAGTNGACTTACDRTQTGCDSDPACVTAAPSCTGAFAITPHLTAAMSGAASCACFGGCQVRYDISEFTFDIGGGIMVVTPGPGAATFGSLTDSMAPICPSFEATVVVGGGTVGAVVEHYTLSGDFTDDDHFTGMFTTSYDGPSLGCYVGSRTVTGTRM